MLIDTASEAVFISAPAPSTMMEKFAPKVAAADTPKVEGTPEGFSGRSA